MQTIERQEMTDPSQITENQDILAVKEDNNNKKCDVCSTNPWKYRCPACSLVTCCLQCVKQHKIKLQCTGVRNPADYIPMAEYNERHMLNDYRFLEETCRISDNARRQTPMQMRMKDRFHILRRRARKFQDIQMQFLPAVFSKHKNNKTFCRSVDGSFCWTVEWHLPESGVKLLAQCEDKLRVNEAFQQLLESGTCPSLVRERHRLLAASVYYQLKLEQQPGQRYEPVREDASIRAVLKGRTLIEFPTFKVSYDRNESESLDAISQETEDSRTESPRAVNMTRCVTSIDHAYAL